MTSVNQISKHIDCFFLLIFLLGHLTFISDVTDISFLIGMATDTSLERAFNKEIILASRFYYLKIDEKCNNIFGFVILHKIPQLFRVESS